MLHLRQTDLKPGVTFHFPSNFVAVCDTTGGGNGWTMGDTCVFPFTYNSKTYDSCTTADNGGTYWCYTVPNGTNGDRWGNCVIDDTCASGQLFIHWCLFEKKCLCSLTG